MTRERFFTPLSRFFTLLSKLSDTLRQKEIMRGYKVGMAMIEEFGHVATQDCYERCCSYPLDSYDKGFDLALKRHTVDEYNRLFGDTGLLCTISYTDASGKEVVYYAKGQLHEGSSQ